MTLPKSPWKAKGRIVEDADGNAILMTNLAISADAALELCRAASALPELIEAARNILRETDVVGRKVPALRDCGEIGLARMILRDALRIVDGEPGASSRTIRDGPKMDWANEPVKIGGIVFPGIPSDCRAWPEFRPKYACATCYRRWDLHDDVTCKGRKT